MAYYMIQNLAPILNLPNTSSLKLDFARITSHQLGGSSSNGHVTSLLDLCLEDNLVAFFPHLCDEGLARDDRASKTNLNVLEGTKPRQSESVLKKKQSISYLRGNSLLVNSLAGNTESAKTVQNRSLESSHLGEGGINMQRAD